MINILQKQKKFNKLFSDENLTRKALLNALSSILDYVVQLMVSFLVTPLMVGGLGDYFFGAWQTLNRVVGYLSPAIGKPTQALRWTIANKQSSSDYDLKRRYVGSAVSVWLLFLPILGIGAVIMVWFVPYWLKAPMASLGQIRFATLLLVINLVMINFFAIPQSVLQGENLGYKRIGLSATLTILGGISTWLILYFHKGIVGIATVALAVTMFSGFLYLMVVRSNVAWFGIQRPTYQEMRDFLGLSIWFVAWDIILKLMVASDVVILAFLNSVQSVTSYTLTKQGPETIISFVAIVVFSVVPGLGGIIGSGQTKKAAQLRGEIMAVTWFILTVLGTLFLIWNRVFIHLWVGEKQYAGTLATLLIILVVYQLVLIKNDASIIDLTLRIQSKVFIGALSVVLAIVTCGILVGSYNLGIIGLCLGLIFGRLILTIAYPALVGRFLEIPFSAQLKGSIRPAFVTVFLFTCAFLLNYFHLERFFSGLLGWLLFFSSASLSAMPIIFASFFLGLSSQQRKLLWTRFKPLAFRSSDPLR